MERKDKSTGNAPIRDDSTIPLKKDVEFLNQQQRRKMMEIKTTWDVFHEDVKYVKDEGFIFTNPHKKWVSVESLKEYKIGKDLVAKLGYEEVEIFIIPKKDIEGGSE